jgi:hypothetical protein
MSYTQVWDHTKNQSHSDLVKRNSDGAFIPMDPDNVDCQEYLAWLDEGNNPAAAIAPDTYPEGNPELTVLKSGGGTLPMDGPVKRIKT